MPWDDLGRELAGGMARGLGGGLGPGREGLTDSAQRLARHRDR